jgi:hypothetical protein
MSESVEQAVRELTNGYPISLAFIRAAERHGLDLRFEGLHNRVVNCIAEHVLLLVGDEEEAAINLLFSTDSLALTAMVTENFISHLATSNLRCAPLWLEPKAA